MLKLGTQFQRTRPLPFPAVGVGVHLHLFCANVPQNSGNFASAWSDWLKANPPVVVACFDERSDYLVAHLAMPTAVGSAAAVLREFTADLERFRASMGTVYDHDALRACSRGNESNWPRYDENTISYRPQPAGIAFVRAERHRQRLLRTVMSRRLRSPADRDSALAAFVAMHNCCNANDVLGGETPMDLLIEHRDGADRAKEAKM